MSNNPKMQCHDCGRWMRLFKKGKEQLFFAGDSFCGHICVECIDKHVEDGTYEVDETNCKRNCAGIHK